jgi:creatinine amidohydrolase/Fe(II)-dependent formamide hydrolase-like protein
MNLMTQFPRRHLLQSLFAGAAWSGAACAQDEKHDGQRIAPARFTSRRMEEMTSREIELYLKAGGDLVLVPFGPISGHGALIPVGMHAHWAHALGVLIAEKANGLVFPVTQCCFAGATRTFRGTVSFTVGEQVMVLKRIASTLQKQGFRRTVLVGGTNPEDTGGMIAARELFDETEKPFWFVSASRALQLPEVKALYESYPGKFGETQLALAALKILGRERPVPLAKWAAEIKAEGLDQPDEIAADVTEMRRLGAIGFRYHEESNHGNRGNAGMVFKGRSDVELAIEVLHKSAEAVIPGLGRLGHYADWLDQHAPSFIRSKERLDEK